MRTSRLIALIAVVFGSLPIPPVSNLLLLTPWTVLECPKQSMNLLRVHYTFLDTVRIDAENWKVTKKHASCLAREYRIHISCGRVYRLMKTMNLPKMSTVKPPRQKAKSNAEDGICQNLLQQKFAPEKPNMAWVCDFTYIRAGSRFYYLCAIMDLFSRKIIAFRLSARINTDLAIATLEDAIRTRGVSSGVMFHTDRGSQFTAKRFRQYLDQHGMIQSFFAKGYPYDNAVMECFFRYLKHEETNRRSYASLAELQVALFRYTHGFYNVLRPHSHNNGLPPIAAEEFVT